MEDLIGVVLKSFGVEPMLLLRHLLRQLDPTGLKDDWGGVDYYIQHAVQRLLARSGSEKVAVSEDLIALPVRDGGLGIPRHKDLAADLFQAAREAAKPTLNRIRSGLLTETLQRPRPARRSAASPGPGRPGPGTPNPGGPGPGRPESSDSDGYPRGRSRTPRVATSATDPAANPLRAREVLQRVNNYLSRKWLDVLPTWKQLALSDEETTEALRQRLFVPIRAWISRHNATTRAFQNVLSCRVELQLETEPIVDDGSLRADFSAILGSSRYFYDVQIVAIHKDSARGTASETLIEAAQAKRLKYKSLSAFFHPLVISAGGLMEKDTAKSYKAI
ncbi:hypothetical protein ACRE_071140 [Hapsidospora chrysogenum ATCC 11550]|uniref:Uncharacterized protein n=1 Tax=Hapsidospora chrysogenum (strain ATCC 11550 / CBS 779.69 / DSM 880 / IAM 14645 / JCM 23072 / IMI 49137) TaxID=857340 RepID=A0A086SYI0_HAPC1|nr:hypothetical protein ACRE_071140 [Hapsidospora chrysogenum ATCC 11550]